MTEPQTWTTIGVVAAAFFAMITFVTTLLTRKVNLQFGALRGEMESLRNEVVSGFDSVRSELKSEVGGLRAEMNARFETVDVRFGTVNLRFDELDRDVQALTGRVFGADRP